MKTLSNILSGIKYKAIQQVANTELSDIQFDSRKVNEGTLFVAIEGTLTDGHKYIDQAIEKGAKHILFENETGNLAEGLNYIKVSDSASALALAASNYYDNPSSKLKLVGVTGTNGKTTIVTLLHSLFKSLGYAAGLLSTIRILIDNDEVAATHTTPDALKINELLAEMVDAGCSYCFMEVSSHAIVQKRIDGLKFSGGIFTNITHDHLDYHKTFDEYLKAKKTFFDQLPKLTFAITNGDDKHSIIMTQNCKASKYTYSIKNPSDYKAKILESDFNGLHLLLNGLDFFCPKVGTFNAYNIMAVYGAAVLLGANSNEVLEILSAPITVDGRFEILKNEKGIFGILDYAHTPDALDNVLSTINDVNQKKHQVITVFGCGGNRDKTKRPKMGQIAAKRSDKIIITSDNPRLEDPLDIIKDIEDGLNDTQMKKTLTISDREQAIKVACSLAQTGDIILVAGKGHEKYQDTNGVKSPFDDKEVLAKFLNENN